MLTLVTTHKFDRGAKRMVRRGKNWSKMETVVDLLLHERPLDLRCHDHKLSGELEGRRECHIEPNWLLVYIPTSTHLILERTGTHSDLFE
jgi:mRNA interferase YafQ